MATRSSRLAKFHSGQPPGGAPVEVLCEDHVGTYLLLFLCIFKDGLWYSAKGNERLLGAVVGWRLPSSNISAGPKRAARL